MRVLIVEDHGTLARELSEQMARSGFSSDCAASLSEARLLVLGASYDVALIDRRLPDGDGHSLLAALRKGQSHACILMLTAVDDTSGIVACLDAGADDYVTKPFEPDELMARIRAGLRRAGIRSLPAMSFGRLSFDPADRTLTVGGEPVMLQRLELALLEAFLLRAGRVVSRQKLINEVWGDERDVSSHNLNALISRLRLRLNDIGAGVEVHPARGLGYIMVERKSVTFSRLSPPVGEGA